jgi:hypothetical protein
MKNTLIFLLIIFSFLPCALYASAAEKATAPILIPIKTCLVLENSESSKNISSWKLNTNSVVAISSESKDGDYATSISLPMEIAVSNLASQAVTISFQVADLNKDFDKYNQLTFWVKQKSFIKNCFIRLGLKESNGEIWLNKYFFRLQDNYNLIGVNLDKPDFFLTSINNQENNTINFENISEIIFYYYLPKANAVQTLLFDNIILFPFEVLSMSDHVFTSGAVKLLQNDTDKPVIDKILLDDTSVKSGDFIASFSELAINLSDKKPEDSGICSYNIKLINKNTEEILFATQNIIDTPKNTYIVTANINNSLNIGQYSLQISVQDSSLNEVVKDIKLHISNKLEISNLLSGPNPFNPNNESTEIQYLLSKKAEVQIHIYSISGELLWRKDIATGDINGGNLGFNSVEWDGQNRFGETVANGVYIAYLIFRDDEDKIVKKHKIAVLK